MIHKQLINYISPVVFFNLMHFSIQFKTLMASKGYYDQSPLGYHIEPIEGVLFLNGNGKVSTQLDSFLIQSLVMEALGTQ